MSRRSRFELNIAVLNAIHKGYAKPTKIMYEACLSWIPLCEILETLVKRECIYIVPGNSRDKRTKSWYRISKKGLNILNYYEKAEELVNSKIITLIIDER